MSVGAQFFHPNAADHIGANAFGVEARRLDCRLGLYERPAHIAAKPSVPSRSFSQPLGPRP